MADDLFGMDTEVAAKIAFEQPVNWLPGVELPAELVTGHKTIDNEHRLLLSSIASLRKICNDFTSTPDCSNCEEVERNRCENDLISMLGDLLAFILDHFKTEEAIMRESLLQLVDREVCEAHMEDHAAISCKVQEIVAALNPLKTVSLIRELDALLSRWIVNHIGLHDVMLVRWIEREDSILRQGSR